jgi:hypothetical protein
LSVSADDPFVQEAEAEKASIMQQFEDAVSRRMAIDQEQSTLLIELNKVKAQIHNFEEARQEVQVRVTLTFYLLSSNAGI